jgi:hypothetical protein
MAKKQTQGFKLFLVLSVVTVILCFLEVKPSYSSVRVLVERSDYRLQKYEPTDGAYLGAYVFQDTLIDGNMAKFNELTGKKHASFFLYVGYGRPVPKQWLAELEEVGAFAHIAWEPNDGLDVVQDDDYLRSFARELGTYDMPIFLRFASEMNGAWTAYGGNPKKYIEKWQLVHQVMKEEAPNVIMVWTVFTFPQNTILRFYPGDDYVDWVGVNIYNVVYHNDNIREYAAHEDPLELLDYVYNNFSDRKPIQISEYGVTHFTTTDGKEYIDFAKQKLTRLYGNLAAKYPRVKSIYYFNVNNLVNAPEGRRINNYALTDNESILATYAKLISNPYFLSEKADNQQGRLDPELMVVRKSLFTEHGRLYIPAGEMEKYFDITINRSITNNSVKINKAGKEIILPLETKPIYRGAQRELYLPLRAMAEHLGYTVSFDEKAQLVTVFKK